MIPNMAPHGENAKPIDPASAILERLQAFVDAHPDVRSPKRLAREMGVVAHSLGMKVLTVGTVSVTPGEKLRWDREVRGWSFDVRAWAKRHGLEIRSHA
jgi:hypothetical protein